jgi:hypothetical protein
MAPPPHDVVIVADSDMRVDPTTFPASSRRWNGHGAAVTASFRHAA